MRAERSLLSGERFGVMLLLSFSCFRHFVPRVKGWSMEEPADHHHKTENGARTTEACTQRPMVIELAFNQQQTWTGCRNVCTFRRSCRYFKSSPRTTTAGAVTMTTRTRASGVSRVCGMGYESAGPIKMFLFSSDAEEGVKTSH